MIMIFIIFYSLNLLEKTVLHCTMIVETYRIMFYIPYIFIEISCMNEMLVLIHSTCFERNHTMAIYKQVKVLPILKILEFINLPLTEITRTLTLMLKRNLPGSP